MIALATMKKEVIQMGDIWNEHRLLIICSILSLGMLIVLAILQYHGSDILKLEAKWLAISGSPVLVALFGGGYINRFKGFGVELESKLKSPIRPIDLKATDAVTGLHGNEKQSVARLPDFKNDQIERIKRLSFISGSRNYYGTDAIIEYFEVLRKLEYVEVKKKSGEFVCLIPIEEFKTCNKNCNISKFSHHEIDRFIEALENENLLQAYSHTCVRLTVKQNEGLIAALQKLRESNTIMAAVVNTKKEFIGLLTEREIEHSIANEVLVTQRSVRNPRAKRT
jgi:hypothetical protein